MAHLVLRCIKCMYDGLYVCTGFGGNVEANDCDLKFSN